MKKYTELTRSEIIEIVNKGGFELVKLNRAVADHLDSLDLSEKARDIINSTDCGAMAECFGGLMTAEEVEQFIAENYGEEEDE